MAKDESSSPVGMDLWREVDLASYTTSDIPRYPAQTLLIHVLWKGVQAGAVAGAAVAPLIAFSRATPLSYVYPRMLRNATIAGVLASLGATAYKEFNGELSVDGVDDRAYRIHMNAGQNEIDRLCRIGACVGAAAGSVWGAAGLRSTVTGGLTGVVCGAALYAFDRQVGMPVPAYQPGRVQPLR